MRERSLRALARLSVGVFYRSVDVLEAERVPASGPLLLVANHPNGLVDPIVIAAHLERMPRFLAKSTLWRNPVLWPLLELARVIPVYRHLDGKVDPRENERSFERCRAELAAGAAVALFPEGISYHRPELQPLKTGAARIALGAEAEHGPLGLRIVPLGLTFERKHEFRSRALLQVGAPIEVAPFATPEGAADRDAVRRLTQAIDAGLREVTLNFASWEEAARVQQAAEVFAGNPGPLALGERVPLQRRFVAGYGALVERAPERVHPVVQSLRAYQEELARAGLTDRQVRATWRGARRGALARLIVLAALAPLAAVGALLNWIPYQLVRRIARAVEHEPDQPAAFKLLASLILYPITWAAEAWLAARFVGAGFACWIASLGPLGGWVAMRFLEEASGLARAARAWWTVRRDPARVAGLQQRRAALQAQVTALAREVWEER
jgi:1-acyl-sn-glycerol-3-phosphate acyltransferase